MSKEVGRHLGYARPELRPEGAQISLHNFDFWGPNCMIVAEKCYAQEELKPWNETRKLQLCAIYRGAQAAARRRHGGRRQG